MKKIVLLACVCALMFAAKLRAQVSPTESGIVYFMPYTEVCIDIEYEEITLERGPFYQYSERYLATRDIVTEDGVCYRISNIRVTSKTTADRNRVYSFVPGKKEVALTREGLLYGIGVKLPLPKEEKKKTERTVRSNSMIDNPFAGLLEEQMLASSISKMAEGTAKQIYRIREAKLNWLCGDVDHMPADGESMQLILKKLDQQEKQLTALFLGKETHKTLHKQIILTPQAMQDSVVFRFSAKQGVVAADDLSGEPYYLTAEVKRAEYTQEEKKNAAPSGVYYNIPGSIHLTLTDGHAVLQEKTFEVGQFGISVAIPAATYKTADKIMLCPKTGALVGIE